MFLLVVFDKMFMCAGSVIDRNKRNRVNYERETKRDYMVNTPSAYKL